MRDFIGVPLVFRKLSCKDRVLWIPYMNFIIEDPVEKQSRNFWVDVYFIDKLDLIVRRAALLRRPVGDVGEVEARPSHVVLEASLNSPRKLYDLLYEAYLYSTTTLKTRNLERATRLSRWSQLKNFLIPIGYTHHLRRDDREASIIRESIRAHEILREALLLGSSNIIVGGGETYWYPVVVRCGEDSLTILDGASEDLKVHIVYDRLVEVDKKAKSALIRSLDNATS